MNTLSSLTPVSYTHLDVYKRQFCNHTGLIRTGIEVYPGLMIEVTMDRINCRYRQNEIARLGHLMFRSYSVIGYADGLVTGS